tara:strand:+ start:22 stop:618 length:597 start_codon:yes stop_codon:yes gene_type:complete
MKHFAYLIIFLAFISCTSNTKPKKEEKTAEIINTITKQKAIKKMDDNYFWELISLIDWNQQENEKQLKPLIDALSKSPEKDILQFEDILANKLYSIDGVEFAKNIDPQFSYGNPSGYLSPDYFLYVRCCVIASGKSSYDNVIKNPKNMPKGLDYEPLLYVASEAFMKNTGKTIDEFYELSQTTVSYETYSNEALWKNR